LSLKEGKETNKSKWMVVDASNDKAFIKSHSGEYLQDHDGLLKTTKNSDAWEKWDIIAASTGSRACTFNPTRLLCFTVMRSENKELLKHQSSKMLGVFGCDDYLVISSEETDLQHGHKTVPISHDLLAHRKGMFKNKDLFLLVWKQVKLNGKYKDVDWIVKVDPDTVLLPNRLRERLAGKSHAQKRATFYANCAAEVDVQAKEHKHFMYGPLEVFSHAAILAYFDGEEKCKNEVENGQDMWEERYMTHCLLLLGADMNPHLSLNLLKDPHCDNSDAEPDCTSGAAAFHHDFTSPDAYDKCWANALSSKEGGMVEVEVK